MSQHRICCCSETEDGCWYKADPCSCNPPNAPDNVYCPCELTTADVKTFKANGTYCYQVSTANELVKKLPADNVVACGIAGNTICCNGPFYKDCDTCCDVSQDDCDCLEDPGDALNCSGCPLTYAFIVASWDIGAGVTCSGSGTVARVLNQDNRYEWRGDALCNCSNQTQQVVGTVGNAAFGSGEGAAIFCGAILTCWLGGFVTRPFANARKVWTPTALSPFCLEGAYRNYIGFLCNYNVDTSAGQITLA